ncbi:MAG: hypothetical protein ACUZ8I_18355 [Candidatus Scalindua sp.]
MSAQLGSRAELSGALPRLCDHTNFTIIELIGKLGSSQDSDVKVRPDRMKVHSPKDDSEIPHYTILSYSILFSIKFISYSCVLDKLS